ncbi:MAG: tetratricopeptide repeat protein, partial [Acidobacteriota bacterium]
MMRRVNRELFPAVLGLFLFFGATAEAQDKAALDRGNEIASEAFKLSREGDQEGAEAKYREALKLAPELHGARFALARLYAGLSRFEEARVEFAKLVQVNPQDAASRRGEVTALLLLGRWSEARAKLEEGLVALPRDGQQAHLLARVLASAPDESVRDGALALDLAVQVYQVQKIPLVAETVAMAFAANGEFDKAARMQSKIVRDAEATGNERGLEVMRARQAAYDRQERWTASAIEIVQSTELPE